MRIYDGTGREIPWITAPTKEHHICVEANTPFAIRLESLAPHTVYAPKLFIDGQEVAGFKTMTKWCNYHGFKLGGGKYRQFLFSEPPVAENEMVS